MSSAGELTFPAGSTNPQQIKVTIIGNNLDQPNRQFIVFLTNPVNATVGIPGAITITIVDNDTVPSTRHPRRPLAAQSIWINMNRTILLMKPIQHHANAAKLTDISLWPVGDQDYFMFFAKKGSTYEVFTTDLAAGLDTFLRVYDPSGNKIAENDDVDATNRRSQVQFTAEGERHLFRADYESGRLELQQQDLFIWGQRSASAHAGAHGDAVSASLTFASPTTRWRPACLIGPGEVKNGMNFVPPPERARTTIFTECR